MEGSPKEAMLTVRIDLTEGGRDPKAEPSSVLCPTEARKTFGFFNTFTGMPLSNRARLFNGKREEPHKPCELSIDGFSIPQLEDENDLWWNLTTKSSEPGILVSALTKTDHGDFLDWEQHQPEPCLLYYIENIFLRTIKAIRVEPPSAISNASLHSDIYKGQDQNLQEWFAKDYAPRITACFTHRPITEGYFIDLQYADLPRFEKESKGRALFGPINYDILKRVRAEIEDRHL